MLRPGAYTSQYTLHLSKATDYRMLLTFFLRSKLRGRTLPEIDGRVETHNKSPSIDGSIAALNSISSNPILISTCRLLGQGWGSVRSVSVSEHFDKEFRLCCCSYGLLDSWFDQLHFWLSYHIFMLGLMTPVIYFEGAASFYSRILWI
jgi:hypothetical protein